MYYLLSTQQNRQKKILQKFPLNSLSTQQNFHSLLCNQKKWKSFFFAFYSDSENFNCKTSAQQKKNEPRHYIPLSKTLYQKKATKQLIINKSSTHNTIQKKINIHFFFCIFQNCKSHII